MQPPFSERKRKAIAELQYDPIVRVILQCRTRFWEKDNYNGFGIADLPQEIWHPTFDQPGPRGLLVSYMFFTVGRRTGAMSEDNRVQFVSGEMEKVYPGLLNNLEGSVSKVWPADPWEGGAAAVHAPGQLTSICVGIEQPEGRIHFAGEHTSRWPGWMQGALASGLRAAEEVSGSRLANTRRNSTPRNKHEITSTEFRALTSVKSPYRIYEVVGLVKYTRIHPRSRGLSRAPVGRSSRPLTAPANEDHRTTGTKLASFLS